MSIVLLSRIFILLVFNHKGSNFDKNSAKRLVCGHKWVLYFKRFTKFILTTSNNLTFFSHQKGFKCSHFDHRILKFSV